MSKAKSLMFVSALVAAGSLSAADVYRASWKQDFEDSATYLNQVRNGVYAKTNSAEITTGSAATLQQKVRTRKDGTLSSYMYVARKGKASVTSYVFDIPETYQSADVTDYKIEWDWYLTCAYGNDTPPNSHYQIVGVNGVLAMLDVAPGDNKGGTKTRSLYNRAGEKIGELAIGNRDQSPEAKNNWFHFTVMGTNGVVTVDVKDYSETPVIQGALLASSCEQLKLISAEMPVNSKNEYPYYSGMDDVAVSLPLTGGTFTWTGAAGDGRWATAGNWLMGESVPYEAPSASDAVIIPGGNYVVAVAEENLTCASLQLGEGVKIGVLATNATGTVEYALPKVQGAALSAEQVTVVGPYESVIDGDVIRATRVPSSFVWVNNAGGRWIDVANWTVGGEPTGAIPGGEDEVRFPAGLGTSVAVSFENQTVSNVVTDTELQLVTGSNGKYSGSLNAFAISGAGKLTLAGGSVASRGAAIGSKDYAQTNLTIDVDVKIAANTTNRLFCNFGDITLNGDLQGAGNLLCYIYRQSFGIKFMGASTNFTGVYTTTVSTGATRDYTTFATTNAASEGASWSLVGFADGETTDKKNFSQEGTYKFGALNGSVNLGGLAQSTLEIGARNEDCSFGGRMGRGRSSNGSLYFNSIKKVGTKNLTFTGNDLGNVSIQSGTYTIGSSGAIPYTAYGNYALSFDGSGATLKVTATVTTYDTTDNGDGTITTNSSTTAFVDPSKAIKNSGSAIVFDSNGGDHTWANALASSNVGGLTKKGAGTLTLDKTPLYTGKTRIEDGELVINDAFDAANTEVVITDPAAAMAAGTVYLRAKSLTGKATIVSDAAGANKYALRKSTVDGMVQLTVGKAVEPLFIIIK